jgi:hypothetical protein
LVDSVIERQAAANAVDPDHVPGLPVPPDVEDDDLQPAWAAAPDRRATAPQA